MKIVQSRWQSIFNRLYTESIKLFIGLIVLLIYSVLETDELAISTLLFLFSVSILVLIWLTIFNSGPEKVVEHGIEINDKEITYINFHKIQSIVWDNYSGFEVTGGWLRQIIIKSKSGSPIMFDYYTFSAAQRRQLFTVLERKVI